MNVFDNFGLNSQLLSAIKKLGFTQPTQIQELSIPHIIEGEDVIGESATGSGKTLAFGCGIVEKVKPGEGIQALVLVPTRELAEQVKNSLRELSPQLRILAIYGGVSIHPQIEDLPRTDVVVATPGRLLDHIDRRTIDVSKVKVLVMDEADRMFEMGFIEDVEDIIEECPRDRQTMFFSATISSHLKDLAGRYMAKPIVVSAKKMVDASKLKQYYYDVARNLKLSLLVYLLNNEKAGLVMVFCNTRINTDFVAKNLKANKIDAIAIHGGLTQSKRTKTISLFNKAKVGVLVCTDVAARGLHIDDVSHIYNYDIPKDPIDYVHRIGRTARAGESGKVINLLCEYDYDNFSRMTNQNREFSVEKLQTPYLKRIFAVRPDNRRNRADNRRDRPDNRRNRPDNGRNRSDNRRDRRPVLRHR